MLAVVAAMFAERLSHCRARDGLPRQNTVRWRFHLQTRTPMPSSPRIWTVQATSCH